MAKRTIERPDKAKRSAILKTRDEGRQEIRPGDRLVVVERPGQEPR